MRTFLRPLLIATLVLTMAQAAEASTEVEGDGYTARIPGTYKKIIDSCDSGG